MATLTVALITFCVPQAFELPKGLENDPLTIIRVLNDAMNAHQFGAALTLFADDVQFINSRGETQLGKEAVWDWMQRYAVQRTQLCDIWLSRNKVTWTVRTSNTEIRQYSKMEAIVQDGKIKLLKHVELRE